MKPINRWRISPIAAMAFVVLLLMGSTSIARQMAFPGEDWEVATPESQDINSLNLSAGIDSLGMDFSVSGKSLAIVRNGRMIWQSPEIESPHPVRSVTKSFTSSALGLLIDDGAVSLDTKVASILPALAAEYPDVTFEHLAMMTSGYHASYNSPWKPLQPYATPGSEFRYDNPAMDQFSNAMTQIAGEPIVDLFQRRVGDPIGITNLHWPTANPPGSVAAVNRGGDGIQISAADAARLGHLFLNRGDWDGQQLISATWVDEATRVQVPTSVPENPGGLGIGPGIYGYNWWISSESPGGWRLIPSLPNGAYFASGASDNLLFVVPQWDLVIAKTASSDTINVSAWDAFFRQVGIAISTAEGGTQFDIAPSAIYSAVDETLDGNGDTIIDFTTAVDAQIGEVDSADSNYIARVIARFSLPEAPAGKPLLAKATLAVYPTEPEGNLLEPLSIWHSTVDNELELLPSDFENSSYVDTLTDIVQPEDSPYGYYDVDVTDLVLADYAADGADATSAFRFQMDGATFVEDDISHCYLLSMPWVMYRPQLLLTFIPERIAGDFNGDGVVDGRDFLMWQRNPSVGLLSDWQSKYGQGVGSIRTLIPSVPEPSTLLLAFVVLTAAKRR